MPQPSSDDLSPTLPPKRARLRGLGNMLSRVVPAPNSHPRNTFGASKATAPSADTRAIQDWLGHRSIQHTLRYTELAPTRFKDFWRNCLLRKRLAIFS